jgi:RHS repeat-associated protein
MLDVNGEAIEWVYDPDNSTQTVLDVFGNPTTYVYDSRGNILTEVDAVGLVTRRTYDKDNNVLTQTIVTEESGSEGWTTTYTYDAEGNKLSETDPLGNVTRWSYNRLGQVLTETDALGQTTTYSYDSRGNLLSTKDANGNVTEFNYDLRGNVLSLTDLNGNLTQFEYDGTGNVTKVADLNNLATYAYDANGNLQIETQTLTTSNNEQKFKTEWTYNKEGQIKSIVRNEAVTEYQYDGNGNLTAVITPNSTTQYRYDKKNQLIETIYPDDTPDNNRDNPRTVTLYDRSNRQRAKISRSGEVTHYQYDAVGRLTETIFDRSPDAIERLVNALAPSETPTTINWSETLYPDATPNYLDDAPRTRTKYYKTGNIQAEIDEQDNRVEYQYDAASRLTLTHFNDNNYITYSYDAAGNRVTETLFAKGSELTIQYDPVGRITATTDVRGKTTQFEYGESSQLQAIIDPKQGRTEYSYDPSGNLTRIKDANHQVTQYEFDAFGRRIAIEMPDGKRSNIVYNDSENTVTVTDFNGQTVEYKYDERGGLESKTFEGGSVQIDYDYDEASGTLKENITDKNGTTTYTYDELSRLISRTDPTGPYLTSGTSIEYEYENGQVSALQTPSGTTSYTYDELGRLKTVTHPEMGTTTYGYQDGNLVTTEFPNHVVETRQYDELNRLLSIKTAKVDPLSRVETSVISNFKYEFNNVGNLEKVVEHSGRQVRYEYDELHRLIKEEILNDPDGNNRVITYVYDAVGNRLEKNDSISGITTYTYNELNQLETEATNGVTTTYTYDDNGNLVSEVTGNHSTTYHWENDGENRLVGVTIVDENGTQNIEYQYNTRGIRVAEIVDGVETRFLIDDLRPYAQVLAEYDAAGNVQTAYSYGYDLISQQRGESELFYHADALGSSRVLTSENGEVTNTYTYDAYGNLIQQVGSTENSYLFAGEQRDFDTGLDYLRARYYDPTIGRFISADAYEGSIGDPMSLHDYLYAHANPVMNTDPSGYVTIGEQLNAFSVHAVLASMGFTGGYGVGTWLTGGDGLKIYDQYLAGFAHGASGGLSTQFRAQKYGAVATQDHSGPFFGLGVATGTVAVLGLGWGAPQSLANASWGQRVAQIHSALSSLVGSYQSTRKILEDRATVWDWLVFLPLVTYFGSVAFNTIVQRTPNVNIYNNEGNLRILSVEELDSAALQLRREFLNSQTVLAVGRVSNSENTVTMAVATNGQGQLGQRLADLLNRSPNWERVGRSGFSTIHAEGRLIARYGSSLEAIGVSHSKGICLVCASDMMRRGIDLASPLNLDYNVRNVSQTPSQGGLLDVSWGWIGENLPNPFQK